MITITPAAAEQIRASAREGNMEGLALRIAAHRDPGGGIQYGMGFDDNQQDGDICINTGGINVIIGETSAVLVDGMTLDFIELEPDSFQFIFMNPNDVNYVPPEQDS